MIQQNDKIPFDTAAPTTSLVSLTRAVSARIRRYKPDYLECWVVYFDDAF
jgi:hypothetical protein